MQFNRILTAATLLAFFSGAATAQGDPPSGIPGGRGGGRRGGFVPGQQRAAGDPAEIARGKTLYGINCTVCHGADLRGGDLGGPNLLRSQTALSDRDGESIVPIIEGGRESSGMPAIKMSPADARATAAYIRSVLETIGRQGTPPSVGQAAPSILVGNAAEGQAYFAAKCASCHSPTGDLQGIASRISDAKILQNLWLSGGAGRGGRGGRGAAASPVPPTTVTVTLPNEAIQGRLIRIDDFFVTIADSDGAQRTIRRTGDSPKIEIHDPLKAHRDLLPLYTDKDVHDLTAYLVTLK